MATHSVGILPGKISWTEEPGWLKATWGSKGSRTQLSNRVHTQVPHRLPFCLVIFFVVQRPFSFVYSHLFNFTFAAFALNVKSEKSLLRQMSWKEFALCVYFEVFMVLDVIIKFLINWIDFCICYNNKMETLSCSWY